MEGSGQTRAETVGRYVIHDEIASGGMASIHLGCAVGQTEVVAIKRMHPHFARDPDFRSMFIDEARVAARIRHPNVVPTIEIVEHDGELLLVMEYVNGESLASVLRILRERDGRVPPPIAASIISSVLHGLHAAHEATNEAGEPLGIVHRDVSPANVLVGADGVTRVLDFGVAKARGRLQTTREGQLKGKLSYMAPEQVDGRGVDRRTDVFCAGAVLWEVLSGRRLFDGAHEAAVIAQLIAPAPALPSTLSPELEPFDEIVFGALQANLSLRYATALEMSEALEAAMTPAPPVDVARWLGDLAAGQMASRAHRVAEIEGALQRPPMLASPPSEQAPFLVALEGLGPPPQPPPGPAAWLGPAPFAPPVTVPPSQVSSIAVTTTRIEPPPVPHAQVRRLAAVGAASALLVALFTALVLPARNGPPEVVAPTSTPAESPLVPPPVPETAAPAPAEPTAPPPSSSSSAPASGSVAPLPPARSGRPPAPQLNPMREPPAEWTPPKPAKPPSSAPAVRSPFK